MDGLQDLFKSPSGSSQNLDRKRSNNKGLNTSDITNRGLSSTLGIPEKYRQHRKSSIPFADRTPQVRFIKKTEEHSLNEAGTHNPIAEDNKKHSILKKSNYPILIDWNGSNQSGLGITGDPNVNQQIEACTFYVEKVIQQFSGAERELRGSLDILTFPVVTGIGIDALARLHCSFIVAIICIEDLNIITAKKRSGRMKEFLDKVIDQANAILESLNKLHSASKTLFKLVKSRYKQWGTLMLTRGEFRIEQRHSIVPVYSKKSMPESVSIYENEIEGDQNFRTDGKAQFYRTEGDLAVMVELKDEIITRNQEELDEDEVYCLIEGLLVHAQQLIRHSTTKLNQSSEALKDKIFDAEYEVLKDRIINCEFETYFDPLCALDLKNTLSEVCSMKEELYNTAQHVVKYVGKMEVFVKYFLKFCKQKKAAKHSSKRRCCNLGNVNAEKLFEKLNNLQNIDFMITIPLTDAFLSSFCHMVVKRSEVDTTPFLIPEIRTDDI